MNHKDDLLKAREKIADLKRQQQTAEARSADLQVQMQKSEERLEIAERSLDQAIRSELRGNATVEAVAVARKELELVQKAHHENAGLWRVLKHEQSKIDADITAAEHAERKVFGAFKQSIIDPLEQKIRENTKLRKDLLAIYGLYSAGERFGGADWDLVLADIFQPPTEDELVQWVEAGEATLAVG